MSDPMPRPHKSPRDPPQPPAPVDPAGRKSISPLVWILLLIAVLAFGWYFYNQRGTVSVPPAEPAAPPAVDIGSEQEAAAQRERAAPDQARAAIAAPADRAATPVARMQPSYPPTALRAGEQGTVLLRVEVDAQGYVSGVDVARKSVSPELDRAAVSAVHEWTFEPAIKDGKPVASTVEVPVEFKLDAQ